MESWGQREYLDEVLDDCQARIVRIAPIRSDFKADEILKTNPNYAPNDNRNRDLRDLPLLRILAQRLNGLYDLTNGNRNRRCRYRQSRKLKVESYKGKFQTRTNFNEASTKRSRKNTRRGIFVPRATPGSIPARIPAAFVYASCNAPDNPFRPGSRAFTIIHVNCPQHARSCPKSHAPWLHFAAGQTFRTVSKSVLRRVSRRTDSTGHYRLRARATPTPFVRGREGERA